MAIIEVKLQKVKGPLVGMSGIDVLVNGNAVGSASLGQRVSVEVEPGENCVQTLLRGVLHRRSNRLIVNVQPNSEIKLTAKYSRFWGNIKLTDENA